MFSIDVDNFKFTKNQALIICGLLKSRMKDESQANCFIAELEKGITYFQTQRKKQSLHNSLPESYMDNDIKKLKQKLDITVKALELTNQNSSSIINQYYYLREKKSIASGDWRLSLQVLLGDISIACNDLLEDSKKFKRKRGYSIELLIVDAIDSAISKSNLDLKVAIGGSGSKCEELVNYLIEEFEISGNSGYLATGRGVIEKWLSKNQYSNKPKKEIQRKNKNHCINDALKSWKPLTKK